MIPTYDQLMGDALVSLGRSQGDVDSDYSGRLVQLAIATSLISIAQELHRMNERADLEEERQELIQARRERQADLANSAFAE